MCVEVNFVCHETWTSIYIYVFWDSLKVPVGYSWIHWRLWGIRVWPGFCPPMSLGSGSCPAPGTPGAARRRRGRGGGRPAARPRPSWWLTAWGRGQHNGHTQPGTPREPPLSAMVRTLILWLYHYNAPHCPACQHDENTKILSNHLLYIRECIIGESLNLITESHNNHNHSHFTNGNQSKSLFTYTKAARRTLMSFSNYVLTPVYMGGVGLQHLYFCVFIICPPQTHPTQLWADSTDLCPRGSNFEHFASSSLALINMANLATTHSLFEFNAHVVTHFSRWIIKTW